MDAKVSSRIYVLDSILVKIDSMQPPDEQTDEQQLSAAEQNRRKGQARKFIAELIQGLPQGQHITAGEVYSRVQDAGLNLSLSTVYRTLGSLKAEGVVQALSGEHGSRYEAHDDDYDHDHLICLSCGFTVEFVDDLLKGFGQVLARRNGYEFKRSRFDLYGLCQDCQSKSEEFKIRQALATLQSAEDQLSALGGLVRSAASAFENRKTERAIESTEQVVRSLDQLQSVLTACLSKFEITPAEEPGA